MATSLELGNVGREVKKERYMVKDVKAKIQVDPISEELKTPLEVDDKDFYVCVNRNVESKFIKDDESKKDKIDQLVVKHRETITVVQGLANTKLTNPDEWIIKIKKELSETTFFDGKEIIDKISQRQEKLERNKENPIVKNAIKKELLKRSKEEQKIEGNANQEEENSQMKAEEPLPIIKKETPVVLDDSDSNKEKEVKNDTSRDSNKSLGTRIVELAKRKKQERKEKMKMTTLEADVKKDSTNGVKHDESVKKEVEVEIHGPSNPTETQKQATVEAEVENGTTNQLEKTTNGETTLKAKPNAPASAPLSAPDAENDVEVEIHGPSNPTETWKQTNVEAIAEVENGTTNLLEKTVNGEIILKEKSNAPASAPLSAPDAENNGQVEIHGPSNPTETEVENRTTNQSENIANGETTLKAKPNAPASALLSAPDAENDVEVEIHGPSNPTKTEVENRTTNQPEKIANGETLEEKSNAPAPLSAPDAENDVEVEIHGPSNPTETWTQTNVEAKVENGTTNHPEEITYGKTSLEEKSNVSGDVELPTSDPNELIKIERELEQGSTKINKQNIYAKEDPEAGKQRVREVFHMDVAELIIERDA